MEGCQSQLCIFEYGVELNDKDPKRKAADHARISRYKNFLTKATLPIGQKEFLSKKLKILYHGHILLVILTVKKLSEKN